MIIITAGHVDHGKSALLQALTGTNPMRLPEEKRRGMTIDIGFAFLDLSDQKRVAFVDVPGHEKFLSNMLVGVGGISYALLVIAADDGVMPQTREHLTILKLLRVKHLMVALTKCDRVDSKRSSECQEEILSWLSEEGYPNPPFFMTAAPQGLGIVALKNYIAQLPEDDRQNDTSKRFRLFIDRVFHVPGAGVVVTGTALSGSVSIHQPLWLSGANIAVRVRALHAQNRPSERAFAGERVAINLTAPKLELTDIKRGDGVFEEEPPATNTRLLVALDLLPNILIKKEHHVIAHFGANHALSKLIPLDTEKISAQTFYEMRLSQPFHCSENDLFILQDAGNQSVIASARVILLDPPRRGKNAPEFLAWLCQKNEAIEDKTALQITLRQSALLVSIFSWARQLKRDAVDQLLHDIKNIERRGNVVASDEMIAAVADRLALMLQTMHEKYPDSPGLGRARLYPLATKNEPRELFDMAMDRLISERRVLQENGWFFLATHSVRLNEYEEQLWQRALPLFDHAPCWVRDVAASLNAPEDDIRALFYKVARMGQAAAVTRDRFYLISQIHRMADCVREKETMDAATLRDTLVIGRKLAVQILEFFDKMGFTVRRGNQHVLRDTELFKSPKIS